MILLNARKAAFSRVLVRSKKEVASHCSCWIMTVSSDPPAVAIIGAGPGGLFFCHALETYRQELVEKGDADGLAKLPVTTCFDRAPGPGGVWRAERSFQGVEEKKSDGEELTNMYEALWTNGPKETIEFFDYTFEDHFGDRPLPVYMPRALILDYIIGRCTKKCPDFFTKYCRFNTSVVSVKYLEEKDKFQVLSVHVLTGKESCDLYDKCIWAAGENGRPRMPVPIVKAFQAGGFRGRVIHSTDTADFEHDCKGKRVLLIGGNFSAEDLALMAIKVGAEKVYISTRQSDNGDGDADESAAVLWSTAWPFGKVEILENQIPVRVTENGTCIQFQEVEWKFPNKYEHINGQVSTELRDIDTVIFCTGYLPNVDMLEEPLREAIKRDPTLQLSVPDDWNMTTHPLTKYIGDVKPNDVRWYNTPVKFPNMYCGMLIDNPSMMFLVSDWYDNPLCGADVGAFFLVRVLAGQVIIPPREEMWMRNTMDAVHGMQNHAFRYRMDKAYHDAYNVAFAEASPKVRKAMKKAEWKSVEGYEESNEEIKFRTLARMMKESNYPVNFGTFETLSDHAKTIIHYNNLSYYHREDLEEYEEEEPWKTFRDYDNGNEFKSLFTGKTSVSLKKRWLDIDASDGSILHDV